MQTRTVRWIDLKPIVRRDAPDNEASTVLQIEQLGAYERLHHVPEGIRILVREGEIRRRAYTVWIRLDSQRSNDTIGASAASGKRPVKVLILIPNRMAFKASLSVDRWLILLVFDITHTSNYAPIQEVIDSQ